MSRYKVVGMKRWKGTLEGKLIDSAKVFVEVKLDDTRNADAENQFGSGMATEEIRLPGGRHILGIEGRTLPFYADLSMERVSNGKVARDVCTGIRFAANMDGTTDAVVKPPLDFSPLLKKA